VVVEREWIKGFLVNKFRGDPGLFADGMQDRGFDRLARPWLIPFCTDAACLPEEDSQGLLTGKPFGERGSRSLSHACRHRQFRRSRPFRFGKRGPSREWSGAARLCQPGRRLSFCPARNAIAIFTCFRREGWDIDLLAHLRRGGHVFGLCGGYQMLGRIIRDSEHRRPARRGARARSARHSRRTSPATKCWRRYMESVPKTGFLSPVTKSIAAARPAGLRAAIVAFPPMAAAMARCPPMAG